VRPSKYNLEVPTDDGALIVNFLSRAVVELDGDALKIFQALSHDECLDDDVDEFVRTLRAGLFLVDDNFDEMAYLRRRVLLERFDENELGIVIAPTMGCNFSCHYCFEHRPDEAMTREIEEELLEYVAQQIKGKRTLAVQWFGGEPLRALDQVRRISEGLISLAKNEGAHYSSAIVTNGHLLTRDTARLLKRLGIRSAQVTLDGDKHLHDRTRRSGSMEGSFERLLANIEAASPFLDVNIRIHVAPFSVSAVKNLLVDLAARDIGTHAKSIYFAPLFKYAPSDVSQQFTSDTKRFYDSESFAAIEVELFKDLRRLRLPMPDLLEASFSVCTAVRANAIVVGPSGRLYKCYFELDKPSKSVGRTSIGVLPSDHLHQWLDHEIARDDECRDCTYLPVCFGGCTHKWQEGARKSAICTRLKHNAPQLLEQVYLASRQVEDT